MLYDRVVDFWGELDVINQDFHIEARWSNVLYFGTSFCNASFNGICD